MFSLVEAAWGMKFNVTFFSDGSLLHDDEVGGSTMLQFDLTTEDGSTGQPRIVVGYWSIVWRHYCGEGAPHLASSCFR